MSDLARNQGNTQFRKKKNVCTPDLGEGTKAKNVADKSDVMRTRDGNSGSVGEGVNSCSFSRLRMISVVFQNISPVHPASQDVAVRVHPDCPLGTPVREEPPVQKCLRQTGLWGTSVGHFLNY